MGKFVVKRIVTEVVEEKEVFYENRGEEEERKVLKVYDLGKYRNDNGKMISKPMIRMNAKWLAEAGFKAGDYFEVCVSKNQMVIRKLNVE